MELYNPDNAAADIERIKAKIIPHYAERLAAGTIERCSFKAGYQNMNLFWASVEYTVTGENSRFGPITAHYTILIKDGEIEFQNNPL